MKTIVLVACHTGQLKALLPVIALLEKQQTHEVALYLQENMPAAEAYMKGQFPDLKVANTLEVSEAGDCTKPPIALNMIGDIDFVLVTLSPTKTPANLELLFAREAKARLRSVFGYSEVPCGHLAPVWRDFLPEFDGLFVAQRTSDLEDLENVVEVGCEFPRINPVQACKTKQRLMIPVDLPFVWYSGGPYHQAGEILEHLVQGFVKIRDSQGRKLSIVFTRHGRDKEDPRSRSAYERAVAIASEREVSIVENSADHTTHETTQVQRTDIIPYSLLLEACTQGGILVTGHGTDGAVKAPRLGIPSILCVGDALNPVIRDEKGCERLPLPEGCPFQVTQLDGLNAVLYGLAHISREDYLITCAQHYPVQAKSPAQIIVDHLLNQ